MGKAAGCLRISQPAVSKSIVELESALGVRLVDRSRRGVVPTSYGLALQKHGIAIFNDLRRGVEELDFLTDPTVGEIRIGTTDPLAVTVVSPAVDRLSRKYPRMFFHVVADVPGTLYGEVLKRNIEVAICRTIGPLPDELAVEILFHDSFAILTAANNPLLRKRKLSLSDLANEPWTLAPYDSPFGSLVAEAFRSSGHEPPRITAASTSDNVRRELLATKRFLTVLPSFMLNLPGRQPRLKAVPVVLPNKRMPIGIVTLKNRTLSPLAQLFIDTVRTIAKPLGRQSE
jgi:DNA-binding transcriptional LysR family regulator